MLKRFFEGILMGLANIIPGVSGGTIALITGIYERLIHAINTLPLKSPLLLLEGDIDGFKKKLSDIDYHFLIPLTIGIATATIVLARFIEFLLNNFQGPTFAFFFGLILASAGTLYIRLEKIDLKVLISAAIGFLFAFYTVSLPVLKTNHSLPVIFISGAVAIVSMILPGISGSFILVFLHQYEYMLNALNNLDIPVIIVFMLGAVIGLFSFTRLLEYLIDRHRGATLAFLFGLMLGALRITVEKVRAASPNYLIIIISALVGIVLVVILEFKYHSLE